LLTVFMEDELKRYRATIKKLGWRQVYENSYKLRKGGLNEKEKIRLWNQGADLLPMLLFKESREIRWET